MSVEIFTVMKITDLSKQMSEESIWTNCFLVIWSFSRSGLLSFLRGFPSRSWMFPEGNQDPMDLGCLGMHVRTQALLGYVGPSANSFLAPVYNLGSEVFTSYLWQIERSHGRMRRGRKAKEWTTVGNIFPSAYAAPTSALRMLCSVTCIDIEA